MQPAEPGLSHYLHVLRRGLWIILLTVALVTGTAVYASLRQTKLYRSSADVFLGNAEPGLDGLQRCGAVDRPRARSRDAGRSRANIDHRCASSQARASL